MPDHDLTPSTAGEFWHCSKCRTPNPAPAYVTTCLGCGSPRPASTVTAAPPKENARVIIKPVRGRVILGLTWAYALLVLAVLALIHEVGDVWWPVTILLFLPRWLFLGPIALLALVSLARRCPGHLLLQGAIALVVAGPLMGACLPLRQIWERPPAGERIRIATYNLGLDPIDKGRLKGWIERKHLDVVCFQEGMTDDTQLAVDLPADWQFSPKKRMATRLPIVAAYPEFPIEWKPGRLYPSFLERLRLRTPSGRREFVVGSVHMPTLREGILGFFLNGETADIDRRNEWWSRQVSRIVAALGESGDVPVVVCGDFNMPPDDSTMAALRSTFRFAFEEAGWGYGYSRPSSLPWIRIDHILADSHWYVSSCRIGPNFGSDHLPMWAELVLPDAPAGKSAK